MFFAVWSLRTPFEMAWTIAPTSLLGSTFGITKNDKDNQAKEERRRGGGILSAQHNMTIRKTLLGRAIFFASFL
jgi:hypothetical protein